MVFFREGYVSVGVGASRIHAQTQQTIQAPISSFFEVLKLKKVLLIQHFATFLYATIILETTQHLANFYRKCLRLYQILERQIV